MATGRKRTVRTEMERAQPAGDERDRRIKNEPDTRRIRSEKQSVKEGSKNRRSTGKP